MSKAEKNYIDKEELWQDIKSYYELDDVSLEENGESVIMPDILGIKILKLAENIMTAQNFSGYPYRDQMVGDAYLRMVAILTKRKFKLWSQESTFVLEKATFKGWAETERLKEIKAENPDYIFVPTTPEDLTVSVTIYKPRDGKMLKHDNKYKPTYTKVDVERNLFKQVKTGSVKVYKYIVDDNNKTVKGKVYTKRDGWGYDPHMVKNNAFGYLSLIAHREGVNRIKRESKNYNAIHDFQEQEFTKFLTENPEMSPQKIDDDTYDDFND